MAVTLAGVLWVVLEQRDGDEHPHGRRQLRYGLILACMATAAQALGTVLAKDGIADYDPAASALIRVLGALVGYCPLDHPARALAADGRRQPASPSRCSCSSAGPWSGRLSA